MPEAYFAQRNEIERKIEVCLTFENKICTIIVGFATYYLGI